MREEVGYYRESPVPGKIWNDFYLFCRDEYSPQDLRSRCHLYIGIGHYLKSIEVETRDGTLITLTMPFKYNKNLQKKFKSLHLS